MKIMITAGGGGHFAPALAVIKKLQKDHDVYFVGRKYAFEADKTLSLEYRTVQELGIPFSTITTGRFQRHLSLHSLRSLSRMPVGMQQSLRLLRQVKPDVVVSFGGYIAVPVTLAAKLLGVPVVLHEQTMAAGLANKIAGKFAQKICLTWESSKEYFDPRKVVMTGNPLRESLLRPASSKKIFSEAKDTLYITGGSLGSHALNLVVAGALEKLLTKWNVLHQTGDAAEHQDYDRLVKQRETLPDTLKKRYRVVKFLTEDEVAQVLSQASLVVSRAGMSTITELLYFRKPALLIPLPHGQRNEQEKNAQMLERIGLARVVKQEDLTSQKLYTDIEEMMAELASYRLKASMPEALDPDAAEKIVTTILSVAEKSPQRREKETKGGS